MSMLSFYTLLSRAPLPGKLSRAAQPAATVSSLARVPVISSRRQSPLFVCRCQKNTYNIHPTALVNRGPTMKGDNWSIMEDNDIICLKFNVGQPTTKEELEVATEDQALLVIRYKQQKQQDDTSVSESPASKLDVRLLLPPGYDGKKVKAQMIGADGILQITIPKPNPQTNPITITE